jgi:hypothetical protein
VSARTVGAEVCAETGRTHAHISRRSEMSDVSRETDSTRGCRIADAVTSRPPFPASGRGSSERLCRVSGETRRNSLVILRGVAVAIHSALGYYPRIRSYRSDVEWACTWAGQLRRSGRSRCLRGAEPSIREWSEMGDHPWSVRCPCIDPGVPTATRAVFHVKHRCTHHGRREGVGSGHWGNGLLCRRWSHGALRLADVGHVSRETTVEGMPGSTDPAGSERSSSPAENFRSTTTYTPENAEGWAHASDDAALTPLHTLLAERLRMWWSGVVGWSVAPSNTRGYVLLEGAKHEIPRTRGGSSPARRREDGRSASGAAIRVERGPERSGCFT